MSHAIPRHSYALNTEAPQQEATETWRQRSNASGLANGVGEKVGDFFKSKDKDELPMYKDKPYNYSSSGKRLPLWRRQRLMLSLLGVLALVLWWTGGHETIKSAASGLTRFGDKSPQWADRQERVREAFKLSWKAYEENAWGMDEYHPVSKKGRNMVEGGMGWIIVDALDTMMLMNLTSELAHAREWIKNDLTYEVDHDVNTFETTIRMLGGLLSAHYLSNTFPDMAPVSALGQDDDDFYLERAGDLADRLMGAYDSKSGVPFASINLKSKHGIPSHDDGGASSTAEAASVQLEMRYLSKLTGEVSYWEAAEKVMRIIDDNGEQDGLLPIFIYAETGKFREKNIRLGSRGDSYYEYLIKQHLQTVQKEAIYKELWDESLQGVRKHLLTYSQHANLTILAERPAGLDQPLFPKMDHLVCFMPGTIALGATGGFTLAEARKQPGWGKKQEDDMILAHELTKTCWGMYKATATGLSPEIAHFKVDSPAPSPADGIRQSPDDLSDDLNAEWRKDFDIHPADFHNLQRPETVESLFYMWRITRDPRYRDWGWEMFESFMKHTFVGPDAGFTSLDNVDQLPSPKRDNMESFWLAETLKYFWLLFADEKNEQLPLTDVVFNTEAHPLPRFEMGRLLKTGWDRKPRGEDGKISQATMENKEGGG